MKLRNSFPLFVALALVVAGLGCAAVTRATLRPVYVQERGTNTATISGYEINPEATIPKILGTTSSVAPFLPPPVGTVAGAVGSIGLGLLYAFARLKGAKTDKILNAVIAGVDAAGNPDVKAKINNVALAQGVQGDLDKKVNP